MSEVREGATFLLSTTVVGESNVFTSVCQEVCPGGTCVTGRRHAWQVCVCVWQGGMHGRG